MAHHAYVLEGPLNESVAFARMYSITKLSVVEADVTELSYDHFSVEDARALSDTVFRAPVAGERKAVIVRAGRLFSPAQNALLKVFEEPPEHTTLILAVPSLGQILPTLRSRLIELKLSGEAQDPRIEEAQAFLKEDAKGREKLIAKIADSAKSDKEEVKQGARLQALALAEGLLVVAYGAYRKVPQAELVPFMQDLERLIPILHEASAPLKQILEHLAIAVPPSLTTQ